MPAPALSAQLNLMTIYITFAKNYIRSREHNLGAVTRAYVERTILETIDGADFPIAYKLAYYNAILNTTQFTSFWLALQMEWGLLDHQIVRYAVDGSLVHQDLRPPYIGKRVHFDDDDDDNDRDNDGDGNNANDDNDDNDDVDTSASAPPRDSRSYAPSHTPSIPLSERDIYKRTVGNGRKRGKKERRAGPMTKKKGVMGPLKGILKK
ncbi:MAG: hypothetical protein Q9216_007126 [Gyalolechia sp. 2 TL-2023]